MSNGDDAMTSAEFAKLMGAYPEPAGNPSPAYGGFMDNSAANFSWVQNNDYFGAESKRPQGTYKMAGFLGVFSQCPNTECKSVGGDTSLGVVMDRETDKPIRDYMECCICNNDFKSTKDDGLGVLYWWNSDYDEYEMVRKYLIDKYGETPSKEDIEEIYSRREGDWDAESFNAENDSWDGTTGDDFRKYDDMELTEKDHEAILEEIESGLENYPADNLRNAKASAVSQINWFGIDKSHGEYEYLEESDAETTMTVEHKDGSKYRYSETDPIYGEMGGIVGHVSEITDEKDTPYQKIYGRDATRGHNFHLNDAESFNAEDSCLWCEEGTKGNYRHEGRPTDYCSPFCYNKGELGMDAETFEASGKRKMEECIACGNETFDENKEVCIDCGSGMNLWSAEFDLTSTDQINNSIGEAVPMNNPLDLPEDLVAIQAGGQINGMPVEEYFAEMEELTDGVSAITNRFGDTVGMVQVDDEDLEDVSVEISDNDGGVLYEGILADEVHEREEDDYYAEMKKPSLFSLVLGVGAAVLGVSLLTDKLSFRADNDTQEMLDNDPELVENPNTGSLSPAQYEELVVESTGYAVDIIPMGLDGSFMGSRFSALPTERYVEYNDPGIGAHIDVALDRNENYLEPEMAMVQAAEGNEVKEAQAPGQSPYLSIDGKEPKDFSYRVLKETHPISLDPAVVPFIPQSMEGYTGNANRPPSVYEKMFKIGVLGQTPSFVPGNDGDIGANHLGTRRALPNQMGNIGGPLSDSVNGAYTDGQTSMSLAQWSIENKVQQTSDTEAMVIDRSSGNTKRIRRV